MFRILVVAPGHVPTFFPKVDPLKGTLDAVVKPRTLANIPPKQILLGRVVDANKKPVANAVVSVDVTHIGNTGHGFPPDGTDPLAVTDEMGEFLISSPMLFDSMDLKVEARSFSRKNFVELAPGQKRHELFVTEGANLSGRVLRDGKPLKEVSVGVVSVDRTMGNFTGDFEIGTAADGKFLFLNLPPERDYYVYGMMNSFKEIGAVPVRKIRVKGDGSMNDVGDLAVAPGRRLAGQVKLSDETPLPKHTRLVIGRREAWDSLAMELPADGKFDLRNLPPESLSVRASLKGYRHSARNLSLDRLNPFGLAGRLDADKTDLTILLEPGEMLRSEHDSFSEDERPENLPLCGIEGKRTNANPWIIAGRVMDAETQKPIKRFRITPGRKHDARSSWTEWQESRASDYTNGDYTVELSKKTGFVVLLAEAEGYLPALSETLASSQSKYSFRLKKGSGPEGVLLLPDGKPAAGVSVLHLGPQEQVGLKANGQIAAYRLSDKSQMLTDPDGRFDFPPKVGGGEIVAANSQGFARISVEELVIKGKVTLQPWARVSGKLVKDGKPVAGEDLDLRWAGNFSSDRPWINLHGTKTDDDGRFTIEHVPPGELQLTTRIRTGGQGGGWMGHPQHKFTARPGANIDAGVITKSESSTAGR